MAKSRLPDELIFIANRRASQKRTIASMAGKVCVVSGSTSGVGLAAARRLAHGGAHIVMVCRNADKAEDVRKGPRRSTIYRSMSSSRISAILRMSAQRPLSC